MIQSSKLKIAIFYDWLNQWGGAEKVLSDILEIYPQADLFTLVYNPAKTKWLGTIAKINTSFINKLPLSDTNPVFYTPFYPISLEQFSFSSYDIVISTTSTVGHALLTPPQTMFVCYYHNINRYLYQTPSQYNFLKPLLNQYRKIDMIYSQRPDYLLTNSQTVSDRISRFYHRHSTIIHPGVDTDVFFHSPETTVSDYYLIVSRLVPHKKIDLAIHACHQLGKKLIIVGEGREAVSYQKLITKINDPNIKLLGMVSQTRLVNLYQKAKALICPQLEDFGLSPLEAMACGTPVIGFNKGGIPETVINGKSGILFDHQTVDCLKQSIINFESMVFDPVVVRRQAKNFSRLSFMLNFRQTIDSLWQQYQNPPITL